MMSTKQTADSVYVSKKQRVLRKYVLLDSITQMESM